MLEYGKQESPVEGLTLFVANAVVPLQMHSITVFKKPRISHEFSVQAVSTEQIAEDDHCCLFVADSQQ